MIRMTTGDSVFECENSEFYKVVTDALTNQADELEDNPAFDYYLNVLCEDIKLFSIDHLFGILQTIDAHYGCLGVTTYEII